MTHFKYAPRQIKDNDGIPTGIWHFTKLITPDDIVPVGFCKDRDCKHISPEEASDCYRHFLKSQNLVLDPLSVFSQWSNILEFNALNYYNYEPTE